jgi:hypothetical protein
MAKLLKTYPANPKADRIVYSGNLDDMLFHLNDFENRIRLQEVGKDGCTYTIVERLDLYILQTCFHSTLYPSQGSLEIIFKVIK